MQTTGHCEQTISDWYNLCRDVPRRKWEVRAKLGNDELVQIDETLLRGKRKYNRGRLLSGDQQDREGEDSDLESDETDSLIEILGRRNFGRQIAGPWVFGLCQRVADGVIDRRFFYVPDRTRATLLSIILGEVEVGADIYSDEWLAYATLNQHGYQHHTVNHSKNFVDPVTGVHTRLIERFWVDLKFKILRSMHGTTPEMLPGYLIEAWWKGLNPRATRFEAFMRDLRDTFVA
ncbi:hypothetical protein B566_EDAN016305 [Ephemera danica]|nr:hypothetical protein B566_EDAN016305 [Ephemera danica]